MRALKGISLAALTACPTAMKQKYEVKKTQAENENTREKMNTKRCPIFSSKDEHSKEHWNKTKSLNMYRS